MYPIRNEVDGPLATAFQEGYGSVRPLPAGYRERETVVSLLILVEYFQSLFLQGNITGEEAERRGERMAEGIADRLATLRAIYE